MHKRINNYKTAPLLLIDDNRGDYEIASRAFEHIHFRASIHWCESGEEALAFLHHAAATEYPSLILLDFNMPGLNGRETLQAIKSNANLKHIPVVVLTSSFDEREVAACYEAGANTYLRKSMNLEESIEVARSIKAYWYDTAILPINKPHLE